MENEPSFLLESAEGQQDQVETNRVGFSSDVEDLFKGVYHNLMMHTDTSILHQWLMLFILHLIFKIS